MPTQFINTSASAPINLADQFRLTYGLVGASWAPDSFLNAQGVETRLYNALPLIGLVPRSIQQAAPGASVVVIRVQPSDLLANQTVGELAKRASFSSLNFSLGAEFLTLGLNVALNKVEKLAASQTTSGTSPIPSDTAAQDKEDKADECDLYCKLSRFGAVLAIIAVVTGVYLLSRKVK